ncbi:hypothetical protein LTR94_033431, partial [Friedmanniomyces endolithicus]
HHDGRDRHRPEDVAPPAEQQHARAERRRQHGHDHEDDEGDRHHPRHRAPFETIAHDRHRRYARRRDREAGGDARGQQQRKTGGDRAQRVGGDI